MTNQIKTDDLIEPFVNYWGNDIKQRESNDFDTAKAALARIGSATELLESQRYKISDEKIGLFKSKLSELVGEKLIEVSHRRFAQDRKEYFATDWDAGPIFQEALNYAGIRKIQPLSPKNGVEINVAKGTVTQRHWYAGNTDKPQVLYERPKAKAKTPLDHAKRPPQSQAASR